MLVYNLSEYESTRPLLSTTFSSDMCLCCTIWGARGCWQHIIKKACGCSKRCFLDGIAQSMANWCLPIDTFWSGPGRGWLLRSGRSLPRVWRSHIPSWGCGPGWIGPFGRPERFFSEGLAKASSSVDGPWVATLSWATGISFCFLNQSAVLSSSSCIWYSTGWGSGVGCCSSAGGRHTYRRRG